MQFVKLFHHELMVIIQLRNDNLVDTLINSYDSVFDIKMPFCALRDFRGKPLNFGNFKIFSQNADGSLNYSKHWAKFLYFIWNLWSVASIWSMRYIFFCVNFIQFFTLKMVQRSTLSVWQPIWAYYLLCLIIYCEYYEDSLTFQFIYSELKLITQISNENESC